MSSRCPPAWKVHREPGSQADQFLPLRAQLRANFERQAAQDGVHHLTCQVEGGPALIECRLIWSTRIPETPGVLGQCVEFVDPAEGYVVPSEEALECLLCRLLGVKKPSFRVWRFSGKQKTDAAQILCGLSKPRSRIGGSDRIRRHAITCPLAQ